VGETWFPPPERSARQRAQRFAPSFARRVPAIPSADVARLRQPWLVTTVLRLALALALIGLLGAALVTAKRLDAPRATFLPAGTSGIVVLDLSQSVTGLNYRRIANTLTMLSKSSGALGAVAFSDIAYELMPPGSPPSELQSLIRFFKPLGRDDPGRFDLSYPANPWNELFSAGTSVSTGLGLARKMLTRDGVEKGSVLLISDLDTAGSDEGRLAWMLARYRTEGIELRIVPLFANAEDREFFSRFIGEDKLITPTQLAARTTDRSEGALVGASPKLLALLALLVAVALAANEWWCRRLVVPEARK
jgi:hypothetical protein